MKYSLILILIFFCLFKVDAQVSSSSSEYNLEKKWVIKGRIFPILIGSSAGIGVEKQIGKASSFVLLFNSVVYTASADSPTNKIRSFKPEFRYHFNAFSNHAIFVSSFMEIGNRSRSLGGEIDPENHTHYQGGNFLGLGLLIGKNIRLGKRFHFDAYIGPKLRFQKEHILERTNFSQTSERTEMESQFGVRCGFNLNYVINGEF